jgi:hypothetical protein
MMLRLKSKVVGIGVLVALVCLAMVGISRTGLAGTDPEPWIDPNQQYSFDKGPGWPAGWTEPAAPTAAPQEAQDAFNDAQALSKPESRPERLELRVLSPMPQWTREYPYYWEWELLTCGKTMYAYFYPWPDAKVLADNFGLTYTVIGGNLNGAPCQFTPVVLIHNAKQPTPEEIEQLQLGDQVNGSIHDARGDLAPCHEDLNDGTDANIFVCFNAGNASEKFDVPAYLDNQVSRVRVPVRFITEMMGAKVDWDGTTETVTIHFPAVERDVIMGVPREGFTPLEMWNPNEYTLNGQRFRYDTQKVSQPEKTIILRVGKAVATVDGQEVKIDAPPVVLPPGRTMVPVRFIAETMGAKVYWVGGDPIFKKSDGTLGGTNQVHIFTPFWPYYAAPNRFLETRAVKF